TSPRRRPSARASAKRGSTTTRSAFATSTSARYTPYAAKNPSVLTPCPNLRERMIPATAAEPLTAAVEIPVRIPLETVLRPRERLPCIDARRRYRHLVRGRARRPAHGGRRRVPRPHVPRHGRRRLHGLAPGGGARRARRTRDRVRPRDVVGSAQQHRAPAAAAHHRLRRPHRQDVRRLPGSRSPG